MTAYHLVHPSPYADDCATCTLDDNTANVPDDAARGLWLGWVLLALLWLAAGFALGRLTA